MVKQSRTEAHGLTAPKTRNGAPKWEKWPTATKCSPRPLRDGLRDLSLPSGKEIEKTEPGSQTEARHRRGFGNPEDALAISEWKLAMVEEMKTLCKNDTWDLTELPRDKRTVGCKWVYTVKHKPDGSIKRPVLPNAVLEKTGTCIQISSSAESLIWRAKRLFFLNGEQDLSAFLLVDLGIVKYPNYNCIISNQIFSSRNDLLAYEEAIEAAQIMDQSIDENNNELVLRCIELSGSRISNSSSRATQSSTSESLVTCFSCFSALWVYSKVVLLGVSFLECERRYNDAINLLKQLLINFMSDGRRGYWTLRLSIDLEHLGCLNENISVAEDGLLDPWVRAGSRTALQRRVLRLGKLPRRWKTHSFSESVKRKITEVHVQGRPLNCRTGMKSRFYGEDGEQCGVEQLAMQYYAGEGGGWQGVHTESGIWLTIFGLLLWDIIFSNVPDVFCTRFQVLRTTHNMASSSRPATQNMASSSRGLLTLFPELNESTREITGAVALEPQPSASGFAPLNFPMRSVEQKMAVQTDIEANQYTSKSCVETMTAVTNLSHRLQKISVLKAENKELKRKATVMFRFGGPPYAAVEEYRGVNVLGGVENTEAAPSRAAQDGGKKKRTAVE
ncbi:hypothetical protein HYC85_012510 [Camellia sinensis]|uniref:Fanconi-associated nuclease n=1 Tax=Camellia sinensis TaxID=4442 RepID=A0A7J7HDC4_CAMSI|nr:hypothetical protein HYC85_012510 [Camellia sinensis]